MALSDDQRALLRLLAKREEGYEDVAALKGLSIDQVRAEVRDALAELDAAGASPPPPTQPPSPPASAPPAPRQEEPKPAELEPAVAPPPEPPARAGKPGVRKSPGALPVERRRFLLLAGGALGVVAVVLIAIALIGGDSDSGSGDATGSTAEPTAAESDKLTQAVLTAADGSDASGRAVFGRVGKDEIVLQVTAENLEPTEDGESYTVWLYRTPKLTLRVGSVPVDESGELGAQLPIPAELLAYVASGAFDQIYISRLEDAVYQQEVAQAKQNKSLPRYSGETVLSGEITGPVAKAGSEGG